MTNHFQRALEGEALTEQEIAQMWAEAPVTAVSPAEYDALCALLDAPAVVNPKLKALAEKHAPFDRR